ncbi:hypothetical protein GGX14DRAFT_406416 [Mycena pura]|uniref:Uncharacterized protein n=1 Tax=Mycena pura TaxID=153505 RepID=A0AAD6Y1J2_9AGAR|nr:hypothetical protein GGX14DRAFT_406416 [Mycena pura]
MQPLANFAHCGELAPCFYDDLQKRRGPTTALTRASTTARCQHGHSARAHIPVPCTPRSRAGGTPSCARTRCTKIDTLAYIHSHPTSCHTLQPAFVLASLVVLRMRAATSRPHSSASPRTPHTASQARIRAHVAARPPLERRAASRPRSSASPHPPTASRALRLLDDVLAALGLTALDNMDRSCSVLAFIDRSGSGLDEYGYLGRAWAGSRWSPEEGGLLFAKNPAGDSSEMELGGVVLLQVRHVPGRRGTTAGKNPSRQGCRSFLSGLESKMFQNFQKFVRTQYLTLIGIIRGPGNSHGHTTVTTQPAGTHTILR